MDHGAFDALTRAVAGEVGSRRAAARLLTGGLLSGLMARIGPDESAGARRKKSKRRVDRERQDHLHAADKKRKKHKKRRQRRPKPAPCGDDRFECPDGSCISFDTCCPGERKCPDRKCVKTSVCCVGERPCAGDRCVDGDQCCPEEQPCPGGGCGGPSQCCPGAKPCAGLGCIPETECCAEEVKLCPGSCDEPVCENGNWECRTTCHFQESICCKGECLLPCSDGKVINPKTCQCDCPDGQWECPGGACVVIGACCPGSQRCGPTSCSQPGECCPNTVQCQEGCCPEGFYCHSLGSCCNDGPPLFCTCPSGYRSEGGLCVPE